MIINGVDIGSIGKIKHKTSEFLIRFTVLKISLGEVDDERLYRR